MRASPVVGSDETSARVGGKAWWQWVLLSSTAICHLIAGTRAAAVVTTFLQGARPEVWVADRYCGQLGHGAVRQMCLAHLLRDARHTPSRSVTRCSRLISSGCCCGPWRSSSSHFDGRLDGGENE
ncbi:MAG: IS66 family transposase, partial [Acetobacteraceae bacterium]